MTYKLRQLHNIRMVPLWSLEVESVAKPSLITLTPSVRSELSLRHSFQRRVALETKILSTHSLISGILILHVTLQLLPK